jgi:hypothetical protein
MAALAGVACLIGCSAGVTGDGSAWWDTLTVASEWFSWELEASMASLLGTGVILEGLLLSWSELDLVVSFRHEEALVELLEDGGSPFWDEALEKKPKMLCCFPEADMDELDFFASDGVLGLAFSPIFCSGAEAGQQMGGNQYKIANWVPRQINTASNAVADTDGKPSRNESVSQPASGNLEMGTGRGSRVVVSFSSAVWGNFLSGTRRTPFFSAPRQGPGRVSLHLGYILARVPAL